MNLTWKWMSLVLILGLMGCNTQATDAAGEAAAETTEASAAPSGEVFGEEISADGAISYAELMEQMGEQGSMMVKVRGTVQEVCQAKGCWMNIAGTEGEDAMMVQFKDYGFFVPKDIAGREVIMEGEASYQETPVEELRHYAEDAGKSAEEIAAITEPKRELRFMASGVILLEE
jgi:hypothetical protein